MICQSQIRALILAPACDGTDIGEAWSTFQWINRLSRQHKLTVLTFNKRNRPRAAPQLPGVEVVEWQDLPGLAQFDRLNSLARLGYLGFYLKARHWLKRHLRDRRFDLMHQISPLALRYPSPAAGLGVPLVIGPLGGSVPTPPGFRSEMRGDTWYTRLRAIDAWRLRHDRLLRKTYESAELVIGVAPYVRTLLKGLNIRRFEVINETAVADVPEKRAARPEHEAGSIRLIFVGRVIRSKGVRDAIRAMGHLTDYPSMVLDVIGDGDDLPACRCEAEQLGLTGRIHFHGWLPRAQLDVFYSRADILMFPSFREPSGNVVVEAMAHGLALIVADNGGPASTVDDSCGIRVRPTTPQAYARDLADAVRSLVLDLNRLARMKNAARDRVQRTLMWEQNVQRMSELYQSVVQPHESCNLAGAAV